MNLQVAVLFLGLVGGLFVCSADADYNTSFIGQNLKESSSLVQITDIGQNNTLSTGVPIRIYSKSNYPAPMAWFFEEDTDRAILFSETNETKWSSYEPGGVYEDRALFVFLPVVENETNHHILVNLGIPNKMICRSWYIQLIVFNRLKLEKIPKNCIWAFDNNPGSTQIRPRQFLLRNPTKLNQVLSTVLENNIFKLRTESLANSNIMQWQYPKWNTTTTIQTLDIHELKLLSDTSLRKKSTVHWSNTQIVKNLNTFQDINKTLKFDIATVSPGKEIQLRFPATFKYFELRFAPGLKWNRNREDISESAVVDTSFRYDNVVNIPIENISITTNVSCPIKTSCSVNYGIIVVEQVRATFTYTMSVVVNMTRIKITSESKVDGSRDRPVLEKVIVPMPQNLISSYINWRFVDNNTASDRIPQKYDQKIFIASGDMSGMVVLRTVKNIFEHGLSN